MRSVLAEGKMKSITKRLNVVTDTTPPLDPESGGRHESVVGVLWEHVLAVLYTATFISHMFWPYILKTIVIIRNNMKHAATGKIPSIAWKGYADDLTNLRVIGSTVFVYTPKEKRTSHVNGP